MKHFQLVFLTITLCILVVSQAISKEGQEAHVTLVETFALSAEAENGSHKVIAFIPRTFLLFDIDKKEPDSIFKKRNYLAATTQDGVRVFILENVVSKEPYKSIFGDQNIIFNQEDKICSYVHCNINDDDNLLSISDGEVFKSQEVDINEGNISKLIGNRGNRNHIDEIVGYIGKGELDTLNDKSIITYATLTHPRYKLTSFKGTKSINTACGERIKSKASNKKKLNKIDKSLISAFNLATIGNNNYIEYNQDYGGDNKEVVYKLYNLKDTREKSEKTYAARIIFNCNKDSPYPKPHMKRKFIESVDIIDLNTSNDYYETFKPEGTPNNLLKFTGSPYLYSVNNKEQYLLLMKKLSKRFKNRALAGYFLSVFNRSCSGEHRSKAECQHSGYEQ